MVRRRRQQDDRNKARKRVSNIFERRPPLISGTAEDEQHLVVPFVLKTLRMASLWPHMLSTLPVTVCSRRLTEVEVGVVLAPISGKPWYDKDKIPHYGYTSPYRSKR